MAKKADTKSKKPDETAKDDTGAIKKAGKVIRDSAEKVVANTSAINSKVIDQAETNAKEAFAAMRAAASAKSVNDIVKIQTKFVKEQGERSMAHVKEVGELIAQFGRDAVEQIRKKS